MDNKRYRNWCFTLNNYTDEDVEVLTGTECKYIVFGREVGEKGTSHLQGYIELNNACTMNALKKKLKNNTIHVEVRRGTSLQASDYCKKDGQFFEKGELSKQGERTDLNELKEMIMDGKKVDDIVIENPEVVYKYGRVLDRIEDICVMKKVRDWMTEGIWICGPSGSGKSHKAYEIANQITDNNPNDIYRYKDDNGWWDNYHGQRVVIIDDFRGSIKFNELLQLIDKWSYYISRRGRKPIPFIATHVIITSIMKPENVYHNMNTLDTIDQLYRRIKLYEVKDRELNLVEKTGLMRVM